MSSAIFSNLDKSKTLSFGNGLRISHGTKRDQGKESLRIRVQKKNALVKSI